MTSQSICEFVRDLTLGICASLVVAWVFYRLGRRDARKLSWIALIDAMNFRLAMLDPRRTESIRPGDGIDDTSHSFLCQAAVMKGAGFQQGADLLVDIAKELVEWQKQYGPKNLSDEQAKDAKTRWTQMLDELRRRIGG